MYQNLPGGDMLAVTGMSALGLSVYFIGGWTLVVAGLALLALVPKLRRKRGWKK